MALVAGAGAGGLISGGEVARPALSGDGRNGPCDGGREGKLIRTVSRRSAPGGLLPGGGGKEIRTVSFFGSL